MTTRFLVVLLVLSGPLMWAQNLPSPPTQQPAFANRADSVAYAELEASLSKKFEVALMNQDMKAFDSIQSARRTFLDTHPFVWRTNFRQDRTFTAYQSLPSIVNKDSITKISILGKGRRRLPDSLYMYKNLAELELIEFRLSRLPKKLLRRPQFRKIILYNNFPKKRLKLPKSSSIRSLTIRGDEKGRLPKTYKGLRNLEMLTLSRNNLHEFPPVAGCDNLKRLDLSLNSIVTLPSAVGKLKNLKSLNLNNNKVQRIEPGVEKISGLQELSLYKNNLSEIPSMLYTMRSLRVIDLYYNHIPRVASEISNWKDVEILYLANNEIYSIPEEIGQLTKLKELYLHHNKLSNLPQSIGNLKDLNIFRINNNNLVEWPAGLNNLKQLGNFDCSSNQFEDIPITDLDFRNMKILSLGGNPWNADARENIEVWVKVLRENDVVVHVEER